MASDGSWNGKRFISPNGASWIAIYSVSAEGASKASHMKDFIFAEGEDIIHARAEKSSVVVAGTKGDKFFYRKAILSCSADQWEQIAFEFTKEEKSRMEELVRLASDVMLHNQASICPSLYSRRRSD